MDDALERGRGTIVAGTFSRGRLMQLALHVAHARARAEQQDEDEALALLLAA